MTGMLVKPQPTWRNILLSPEAVDWLIALLNALQGRPDTGLAAAARQLLVCAPACLHQKNCFYMLHLVIRLAHLI